MPSKKLGLPFSCIPLSPTKSLSLDVKEATALLPEQKPIDSGSDEDQNNYCYTAQIFICTGS
jgi:hypothetical protein